MKVDGTGEKEGKTENAMIVAAILSRQHHDTDDDDKVPTLNVAADPDTSDDDNDGDDLSLDDEAPGHVIIIIATRTSLMIQNQVEIPIHPIVALHPPTYVNKILLGGHDGLVLVNIRSGKTIHRFKSLPLDERITTLEQSPAIDTVAVGCTSGNVHLLNLRHDKRLFGFKHPSAITSLSFRTDSSALQHDIAPLAVGRKDGTVSIWDLSPPSGEESMGRTLLCEMINLHPGGISCLRYLPQEPVLVSTGKSSNSILMHIFDAPDHSGRLLRSRKGHISPPKCIRYLFPANNGLTSHHDGTDAAACQILSGGSKDRTLRVFSSARSVLDKEYSQGQGLNKKSKKLGLDSVADLLLPPVVAMASSQARSRDWGDLVTIHESHSFCYVWSSKRGAQSGPVLRQSHWNVSTMKSPPPKSTHATSVAMSSCGNYAIVGTRGGIIFKYNVQSGLSRGQYPPKEQIESLTKGKAPGDIGRTVKALEKKFKVSNRKSDQDKEEREAVMEHERERKRQAKLKKASHQHAAVTGLAVDAVNKTLISVGEDAKLILWNFLTHAPHKRSPYILPSPATMLSHIRDSDLAAISLKDFSVVLFDCSALQIVRRFGGGHHNHSGPISDVAFAPDGRTLYTASLDRTIRVWDVPTNHCVDWMAFHTAPTSLTVSPTGEFLATTHVDSIGISMWSDKSFYRTVFVDGANAPLEPFEMDDPIPMAEILEGTTPQILEINEEVKNEDDDDNNNEPPQPKEKGMVTLSGLPPAHWKNLFHLELVKERNKPAEAPKKPPTAPFFLQYRSGENILGAPPPEEDIGVSKEEDNDKWASAWSDDETDSKFEVPDQKRAALSSKEVISSQPASKKRKVTHHRSHLAALLLKDDFQAVTNHVATLGPSSIDVSLSTLCNGMHDLEQGLPLLTKAAQWLLEASKTRERYEAVNSYLHRFIFLHGNVIAGIEESFKSSDMEDEGLLTFADERKILLGVVEELRKVQV
eukprot:CAMPEP_0194252542 /NCGR_PEP_ID=MMETSP0158-20130606/27839_1 /TAXON_ID=33649 /ORGANISM="Thalassionema nitzschioides, Strain L26-B" /LENGTH=978 /DNA_ID=CAMNT_0038989983 /DNA_START=392 /DNA_END=3324 /DNA_ORIENTATION=-